MADVQSDNVSRRIAIERDSARLAESAHQYFTRTKEGQKLLAHLEHESGASHAAFNARDSFNPHAAAFRDGMRATYLIISNIIKHHESNE